MRKVVFLDRHHSGKPHNPLDRGAWGDLDQNGRTGLEETEAMLTARYLWYCELKLIQKGFAVLPICDGRYSARHDRVNGYCRSMDIPIAVYVAAHINAGGGEYGACFHDWRSEQGERLARRVAAQLNMACVELSKVVVAPASHDARQNALATIEGIYEGRAVGLCFEPFFLDSLEHGRLATEEGLRLVGESLARGIVSYFEG